MTTKIKTLIVDDEELARERLRELLGEHSEIEVIDQAENGIAAIEKIEDLQPDLIFLDIEMPGCSGLEVIRSLTMRPLPKTIFCTAYDQYAIQAFELNAVDYLLKPVSRARLGESLKRIKHTDMSSQELHKKLESLVSSLKDNSQRSLRRFLGRRAKKIYLLNETEVLYFRVDRNLVFMVTDAGEYWTNYTISQLQSAVDATVFFRTHRQYLVNLNKIKEVAPLIGGTYRLTMANGSHVEVSRRQSKSLMEKLK